MLLNPNRYTYELYKEGGLAGAKYLGTPKTSSLCRVVVKDYSQGLAVSEFIGCMKMKNK